MIQLILLSIFYYDKRGENTNTHMCSSWSVILLWLFGVKYWAPSIFHILIMLNLLSPHDENPFLFRTCVTNLCRSKSCCLSDACAQPSLEGLCVLLRVCLGRCWAERRVRDFIGERTGRGRLEAHWNADLGRRVGPESGWRTTRARAARRPEFPFNASMYEMLGWSLTSSLASDALDVVLMLAVLR